ncbi:hypothetical protein LY78DRAFT_7458 [Colletotrichum sublineola]|nr:hypothetical protein LY78DRAFT_7458 [Colletotrichum sublineola]
MTSRKTRAALGIVTSGKGSPLLAAPPPHCMELQRSARLSAHAQEPRRRDLQAAEPKLSAQAQIWWALAPCALRASECMHHLLEGRESLGAEHGKKKNLWKKILRKRKGSNRKAVKDKNAGFEPIVRRKLGISLQHADPKNTVIIQRRIREH